MFKVGDKVRLKKAIDGYTLSQFHDNGVYPSSVYTVSHVFKHPNPPLVDLLLLNGIIIKKHVGFAHQFFELATSVGFIIE